MVKLLLFIYGLFSMALLMASDRTQGVHHYDPVKHEQQVRHIASANLSNLVSFWDFDLSEPGAPQKVCESQVMACFKDPVSEKRVFLNQGQVKGFVTYRVALPWYRSLVKSPAGASAAVQYLAVDESSKRNGYGEQLVKAVLDDCNQKSVGSVSLWTNGSDKLHAFYAKKLGFNLVNRTKLGESNYQLRLRPHPLLECLGYARKLLHK